MHRQASDINRRRFGIGALNWYVGVPPRALYCHLLVVQAINNEPELLLMRAAELAASQENLVEANLEEQLP